GNDRDDRKPEDAGAVDSPLFRVANHHATTVDNRRPSTPMNLASTTATLPINTASRRFSSTITGRTRRLSGWAIPVGATRTESWMAMRRASSLTNQKRRGFAPAG